MVFLLENKQNTQSALRSEQPWKARPRAALALRFRLPVTLLSLYLKVHFLFYVI